MQNITIVGGEFREYQKALEKAPILSSGSKQELVEAGSVAQKLQNSSSISGLSCRSNASDRTRIGLPTGLKLRNVVVLLQ